jgi:hypothetical protein
VDLEVIHETLRFYLDKFQMGWYSPAQLDSVLDRAQMQFFNNTKPQYAISQDLHDTLLPFKAEYVFVNGTSPAGLITFPDNYESLITVEVTIIDSSVVLNIPVELMNEAQISDRRSSQLTPVSTRYPVGLLKAGRLFQLFPTSASAGTVYYLRRPVAPEFVYAQTGRTVTYDQLASTQMEWDDTAMEKIMFIALGLLGINLQSGDVMQLADVKEKSLV